MDTIIQHCDSKQYRTKGGWVSNRSEALSFRSSLQALDYCCQHGLRDVILLLRFNDPKFDIQLHPFAESEQPVGKN